jgi:hypothetical protein
VRLQRKFKVREDTMDIVKVALATMLWKIRLRVGERIMTRVCSQFDRHVEERHNADFEVCPQCPAIVRLLDAIGQNLLPP